MAVRTTGLELRRQGTRVLALHPGTVATDLSAPFARNVKKLLSADESASSLLDVIDAYGDLPATAPHDHDFFDFNGKRVEW